MTERDERLREIRERVETGYETDHMEWYWRDVPYLLAEIERLETELRRERQMNALDEMARDAAAQGLYQR